MTSTENAPAPEAVGRPQASPAFRITAAIGGGLGLLMLAACIALAVYSFFDTSSSTAAIGIVVAVVLATPVLLGLGLILGGLLSHRSRPGNGFALVLAGTIINGLIGGLIGLQLLFGS